MQHISEGLNSHS